MKRNFDFELLKGKIKHYIRHNNINPVMLRMKLARFFNSYLFSFSCVFLFFLYEIFLVVIANILQENTPNLNSNISYPLCLLMGRSLEINSFSILYLITRLKIKRMYVKNPLLDDNFNFYHSNYKKLTLKTFLIIIVIFLILNITIDNLYSIAYKFKLVNNDNEINYFTSMPQIVLIMITGFLTPIIEEIVFRGILFGRTCAAGTKFIHANIIQALLFSCVHENWFAKIYAFVMAFFFGLLYNNYRKLWLTILLHISFNMWGIFISDYMYLLPSIVNILISVLSISLLVYIYIKTNNITLFSFKFSSLEGESSLIENNIQVKVQEQIKAQEQTNN